MHSGYVEIRGLGYREMGFCEFGGWMFVFGMRYWELGGSISDSGFCDFCVSVNRFNWKSFMDDLKLRVGVCLMHSLLF